MLKKCLTVLVCLIFVVAIASISPKAGKYTHIDAEGSESTITLVAKGKNFQVGGSIPGATISGTLYGATGKIRVTLRAKDGREVNMNGYWNYAKGGFELMSVTSHAALTFVPAQPVDKSAVHTNYTGNWDTSFGKMHLTQTGNHVTGSYDYYSGQIEGDIHEADGQLYFKWTQKNPDKHGTGYFKLNYDASSFSGGWDYTNASGAPLNNGGGWSGRRIQ